jgi:hypothetical protein
VKSAKEWADWFSLQSFAVIGMRKNAALAELVEAVREEMRQELAAELTRRMGKQPGIDDPKWGIYNGQSEGRWVILNFGKDKP